MKIIVILLIFLHLAISSYSRKGVEVEVEVDATKTVGKLEPFWASQIIHPTEFLLTEWGRNFIHMLKESGAALQYVRIYNQPERAIRLAPDGNISYDWEHFDKMADLILSTGNKLEIAFFGMPVELAIHPESVRKRPYGAVVCTSPPKEYRQWEELCADFTRHVISKYGLQEVKKWTFRCWNEPDGGFWYKSDLNEYLKLYDHFAKGVKEVNAEITIGGPALTGTGTWNKPENFRFILDHIVNGTNFATGEKGSPIDFIAIHTYGGSSGGPGPGRKSPEVDYMMEQQIRLADIRDEFPTLRNIPIHVEEWGETSGGTTGVDLKPSADIRNSQYGAAFLATWVGRHIQMKQKNDRKIEKFTFCSSGYEKIPERDFMGYRTFDTKSGFCKPILNAYRLLSRMAPEMIPVETSDSDENVIAYASCDKQRITVVITNYQSDKINNDGMSYPVSLTINTHWNQNTKISVRHWRIDEDHSNAYTVYKKLGAPVLPNPIEIDAVKSRMGLELFEEPVNRQVADLKNIEFQLPCNAVSLIEITRN